MKESSIFGNRQPGDCTAAPQIAILYDGTNGAVLPTIAGGVIIFGGGLTTSPQQGIGANGFIGNGGAYRLDYDQLLNGGSGAIVRTSVDSLKKKMRLQCAVGDCGNKALNVFLKLAHQPTCEYPRNAYNSWVQPIDVQFTCECAETCCQKLNKAKDIINSLPDSPVVATVVNIGTDYFLDLEAKVAGLNFIIDGYEGFLTPQPVVPYFKQYYTAKDVRGWFGTPDSALLATDTKKLTAIELFALCPVESTNAVGIATSNPLGDPNDFKWVKRHIVVLFDETVTASLNAFNALKAILAGPIVAATPGLVDYFKKLVVTTTIDFAGYVYTIISTDAGDAAALTTARTNYPTGVIALDRMYYVGGKSYYAFRSTSATLPTPVGGDVTKVGLPTLDEIPSGASTCPAPEDSICLSC